MGTARLRWYVAFATMTTRVVPRMISTRKNGMFTLEVAAWTMISPMRMEDRAPWKKRESRSLSRNAVPVSQTATATATETYPKSIGTETGGVNRYAMWTRRKTPARVETTTCAPLTAVMFFVIFRSFDRSSMNIEDSPIRIRAKNPEASPIEMPPNEIAGSVDTRRSTTEPALAFLQ